MSERSTIRRLGKVNRRGRGSGRPSVSGQVAKNKRKARLFTEQKGLCCYCGKKMLCPTENKFKSGKFPGNLATLEHLDNKLTGKRKPNQCHPAALACYSCNHAKGVEDEKKYKQNWGVAKIRDQIISQLWMC